MICVGGEFYNTVFKVEERAQGRPVASCPHSSERSPQRLMENSTDVAFGDAERGGREGGQHSDKIQRFIHVWIESIHLRMYLVYHMAAAEPWIRLFSPVLENTTHRGFLQANFVLIALLAKRKETLQS